MYVCVHICVEEEEEEEEEEVSLCGLLPDAPSWQQPITDFFVHGLQWFCPDSPVHELRGM